MRKVYTCTVVRNEIQIFYAISKSLAHGSFWIFTVASRLPSRFGMRDAPCTSHSGFTPSRCQLYYISTAEGYIMSKRKRSECSICASAASDTMTVHCPGDDKKLCEGCSLKLLKEFEDTGDVLWHCPFCRTQLDDRAIEQTPLGRSIEYWKAIARIRKEYIATGRQCVSCDDTNRVQTKIWRLIQREDLSAREIVIAIGAALILEIDGVL